MYEWAEEWAHCFNYTAICKNDGCVLEVCYEIPEGRDVWIDVICMSPCGLLYWESKLKFSYIAIEFQLWFSKTSGNLFS